jgi:hypothetical protein
MTPNAVSCALRFAFARKNRDAGAANAFGLLDEKTAIARVAAGGGRDRPDAAHAQSVTQRPKTMQGIKRGIDGILREQTGGLHLASETRQNFLVENGRRAAREALVNHEAHRVRTNIDDRNRRPMIQTALSGERRGVRAFTRLRRGGG